MVLAQYFSEFILYSFLGWIWESIYCTIKEKRWQDRGFLFGPVCPIYGASVVVASMIFSSIPVLRSPDFPVWAVFLICMLVSAVAEYATSWVLEKRFHARWWDYSRMPFNINGRICLPASIGFGLVGILIIRYLLPAASNVHSMISPFAYELIALVFAMILGADIALTEASLTSLLKRVEDMHSEFNEKAQENYEKVTGAPKLLGRKIQSLSSYASNLNIGQRHILKKITIVPDKKRSETENKSRMTFWRNLREAAYSVSGRTRGNDHEKEDK